jgi:hypothetical protein
MPVPFSVGMCNHPATKRGETTSSSNISTQPGMLSLALDSYPGSCKGPISPALQSRIGRKARGAAPGDKGDKGGSATYSNMSPSKLLSSLSWHTQNNAAGSSSSFGCLNLPGGAVSASRTNSPRSPAGGFSCVDDALGSPKGLFQGLLKKRVGLEDAAPGASGTSQSNTGSSTGSCGTAGGESVGANALLGVGLAAGAVAATGHLEPVTMVFIMVEGREQLKMQHAAHIR